MRLSEHKELKIEILALPLKEKDKLLLRLVARDRVLTEHLHFLLLEDKESLSNRVATLKEEMVRAAKNLTTPKEVLINLRKSIKSINHFLKVTKANFEEVELRVFLLNHTETEFKRQSFSSTKNYEQLFSIFYIKSIRTTLNKFEKLHEDLQFDLREDLNKLLDKAYTKNTATIAVDLELPKQV